jgi:hypothetical protein
VPHSSLQQLGCHDLLALRCCLAAGLQEQKVRHYRTLFMAAAVWSVSAGRKFVAIHVVATGN